MWVCERLGGGVGGWIGVCVCVGGCMWGVSECVGVSVSVWRVRGVWM